MNRASRYFLGLLIEEMGEVLKGIGKAMRFGLDVPGPNNEEYQGKTARDIIGREAGDLCAAIALSAQSGLFSTDAMNDQANFKHAKLIDPTSVDNRGRRLCPEPVDADELDVGP